MESGRDDWAWALPMLTSARNEEYSRTIKTSAFAMFFARGPRAALESSEEADAEEEFLEPAAPEEVEEEEVEEEELAPVNNQIADLNPAKPFLLFTEDQSSRKCITRAIAIAHKVLRSTVHFEPVGRHEGAFSVEKVLANDFLGRFLR